QHDVQVPSSNRQRFTQHAIADAESAEHRPRLSDLSVQEHNTYMRKPKLGHDFESVNKKSTVFATTSTWRHAKVHLEDPPDYPDELKQLLLREHPKWRKFRAHIRNYNSSVAFIGIRAKHVDLGAGVPHFRIQGKVHTTFNHALHPEDEDERSYGQLFLVDTAEAVKRRVDDPRNEGMDAELAEIIDKVLRHHNPYVGTYLTAYELMKEARARLEQERRARGEFELLPEPQVEIRFHPRYETDPRYCDLPQANEVAAIFTTDCDGLVPDAYVTVHERGKDIRRIHYMNPMLESAAFPLIYPSGCQGYTNGIGLLAPDGKRIDISRREYASFRMAVRAGKFNPLHHCGRLFQEWAVSTFAFMEGDRMNFYKLHQKELKADSYNLRHFLEGLHFDGDPTVGNAIILPATYPGSPRFWQQSFEDAMAIVRYYGRPDIFLTMTCNPSWPEITDVITVTMEDGEEFEEYSTDRPDIIARVFDMKKDALLREKRGLPHLHAILTQRDKDKIRTPGEIDRCISAQIPDESVNPRLFELVQKHHIHGPNCRTNSRAMCKDAKGLCRWKFPKPYQLATRITDNGRVSTHARTMVDVAPYCPRLLLRFQCHVYVDIVQDHMATKYLYKYCTKGPDRANASITNNTVKYDEINLHLDARCVTPPEAMWRLQGRALIGKSHTVQKLDIHFKGKKVKKHSTLDAFFRLNASGNELAKTPLNSEVPAHFVMKNGEWVPTRSRKVVSRIYSVSPAQTELYMLRTLLLYVKGPTSYEDLYVVDGEVCPSYAIACLRRGITT
ncbi:Protein Y46B2A.2, partial [Aphelenchoides avenae]